MTQPADLDNASVQAILELGGPELFADLVADFRPFAAQAAERIRAGIAAGDCPAVAEAAHSIKSTSATLGAMELNDVLVQVESCARDGRVAELRAALPRFEAELTAADAALTARAGAQ